VAEAPPTASLGMRVRAWAKEVSIVIVAALVLSFIIKTFFFQSFFIPSSSMESTLDVGDRILVTKWRPGPMELRRGDIVVFKDPSDWLGDGQRRSPSVLATVGQFTGLLPADSGEHLVKRIIGLPGDVVECCDAEGRLIVNGVSLDEPYLADGIQPSAIDFAVTVPDGYLWLMGDNRPFSADSRAHMGEPGGGAVPIDHVVGTAFARVWPFDSFGGIGNALEDAKRDDADDA